MSLANYLNYLDEPELQAALIKCCASTRWGDAMAARRPFASDDAVCQAATDCWWTLDRADWLEAFAGHPKIGDVDALRSKFASTSQWAEKEQAGAVGAPEDVLQRLTGRNREYEDRFGYIFIVCASGKSAVEMLAILEDRLPNQPTDELKIAATEQMKITLLRLDRLGPPKPTG